MAKSPTAPKPVASPPHDGAHDRPPAEQVVRQGVLAALGRPPGLYGVDVRPLWDDCYRVNVLVGPDLSSVRIAHSFFVEAAAGGDILTARPRITRQYP